MCIKQSWHLINTNIVTLGCNCGAREWKGRLGREGGFHEGGWGEDVSVSCFLFYTLCFFKTTFSSYIHKNIKIAIVFSLSCPHISIDVMAMFFNFTPLPDINKTVEKDIVWIFSPGQSPPSSPSWARCQRAQRSCATLSPRSTRRSRSWSASQRSLKRCPAHSGVRV